MWDAAQQATFLANSKETGSSKISPYLIRRPRLYTAAELKLAKVLLPVFGRLSMEHMLDTCPKYQDEDIEEIEARLLNLQAQLPGADLKKMAQRHPRLCLVQTAQFDSVVRLIQRHFPGADVSVIMERIPFIMSRNVQRLERNIGGIKQHLPGVGDGAVQACPSLLLVPPDTIQRKVQAVRRRLPDADIAALLRSVPALLMRRDGVIDGQAFGLLREFPELEPEACEKMLRQCPGLLGVPTETLAAKMTKLCALLPGLDVRKVLANGPHALLLDYEKTVPQKVQQLQALLPAANITAMVNRMPRILSADIQANFAPKVWYLKRALDISEEDIGALVTLGPWLLKAGWGPLCRVEYAKAAGLLKTHSYIHAIIRSSKQRFADDHPGYRQHLLEKLQLVANSTALPDPTQDLGAGTRVSSTDTRSSASVDSKVLLGADESSGMAADWASLATIDLETKLGQLRKDATG